MKTIKKSIRNNSGEIVLKLESLDDVWQIGRIIEKNDLIKARTERKIKLGKGDEGTTNVVKKTIVATIAVEKTGLQPETANLRVSGTIQDAPEDIPRGSHHTITLSPNTTFTLIKEKWHEYQLDIIKECCETKPLNILVVIFDREEAFFVKLKNNSYQLLSQLKADVAKKDVEIKSSGNFYRDITAQILEYEKREPNENIIVASPAFWKEYLMNELPQEIRKKTISASCSAAEMSAIDEILKRPELNKALEQSRNRSDQIIIDELLGAISKGVAAYGLKDVKANTEIGNARQIIVSDGFMRKNIDSEAFSDIKGVLDACEKSRGKVHIVNTPDASKKIDGLGGIAAFLRWKNQN